VLSLLAGKARHKCPGSSSVAVMLATVVITLVPLSVAFLVMGIAIVPLMAALLSRTDASHTGANLTAHVFGALGAGLES